MQKHSCNSDREMLIKKLSMRIRSPAAKLGSQRPQGGQDSGRFGLGTAAKGPTLALAPSLALQSEIFKALDHYPFISFMIIFLGAWYFHTTVHFAVATTINPKQQHHAQR